METGTIRRGRARTASAVLAASLLSGGLLALAPTADAADPKPDVPAGATAAITTPTVAPGGAVSFTGTGWTTAATTGKGAVVGGVKLDDVDQLNTAPFTAGADGALTGTVTLPTTVTPGTHWLRFLSGADQAGDPTRSIHATFTVAAPAAVTLLNSTVAPGSALSASGTGFGANATVTMKLDKTATLGTTTAGADGAFSNVSVTVPAETASGAHTLYFLAAGGISVQAPVTVQAASSTDPGPQFQLGTTITGVGGSYEVAVDAPLGKAFVASPKDGSSGSVVVVDLATRAKSAIWALTAAPYGIAVNTTTHKLYTTDTRLNQVSVYDARTGAVLGVIPNVSGPHGLEVDSVHNLVYVTLPGSGVAVVDGATDKVVTTVAAGKTPVQVAIDGAHDSYWVASTGDNTVRQFDRATNKLKSSVVTAAGPQNLVVNAATNELLVDNFGAASVQVVDTSTSAITATVPVAASPIGIALDRSTNTWFVTHLTSGGNNVSVVDGNSRTVSQVLAAPGIALGVGADSGTHTAYVTNRDGAEISVLVPAGTGGGPAGDGPRKAGVVVTATVPDTGGLAISVSAKAVALGPASPNAGLTALQAAGTLPTVTVADLRSTNPGWTITGAITAFTSEEGATVSGSRLGWTPAVLTSSANQAVTAGARVQPAATGGLASGATLASAAAGKGVGTATVNAALTWAVPTDTKPGTYSATLTLTAI